MDESNLKVMLLNNYTFDATDTAISQLTSWQVSGNGWASGGEAIASGNLSIVNTNEAMLDGIDIDVEATGGAIGPADGACIYDVTGSFPLWYIDFEGEQTANTGAPFRILWNASGIARWIIP